MEGVDTVRTASGRPEPVLVRSTGRWTREKEKREKKVQLAGGECLIPRLPPSPRRPVNIKVRLPDVRCVVRSTKAHPAAYGFANRSRVKVR